VTAFETLLACEFVGDLENLPPEGGGDLRAARPGRSRFAGSAETLAEGSAAASGGADFPGIPIPRLGYEPGPDCTCSASGRPDPYSSGGLLEERFAAHGAVPVTGPEGTTPNGARVFQTHPTCPADGRRGQPALLQWTLGLANSVVSDVHLEICLDVRKCQEADDALGQAMTLSESDFRDEFGAVAPPTLRVVHHRGALRLGDSSRCACEDVSQDFLSLPGTFLIPGGPPPHVPLPDPDPNEEAPHSLQFLGRGCTVVMVNEMGQFAPQDFLTVELRIPASTRVRIRAASDSAAVCYVGTPSPGQRD
jgi:hypothetical protein